MGDGGELRRAFDGGAPQIRGDTGARRRAARRITLVLIGTASVSACDDPAPSMVNRDLYDHRGKCVQDWGEDKKCELITDGQYRGYWYGPGYVGSRSTAAGYRGPATTGTSADASSGVAAGNPVGTHRVARSGFGSSSSAHSSGS